MNPNRHFCTLFDSNYLLKGVVMIKTLIRHSPDVTIHVLCMDEITYRLLDALNFHGVVLLRLADVEDEELLRVKPGRSIAEYCWTLSAALCWHLLSVRTEISMLTYLDADLMFFSAVEPLFDEIGDASISIIEHRFSQRLLHLEAYGRFNVEWVSFRRTADGMHCLKTWRDQCIEWCFARLEDGRLGDQKYLDAWPKAYPETLHILQNKGAGVAPWNFSNYRFFENSDKIFVDNIPLIFYHFHQFQLLSGGNFSYMSSVYSNGSKIPNFVYKRYESELIKVLYEIQLIEPGFSCGIRPAGSVFARRFLQKIIPVKVKNFLRRAGIQMW